MDKKKIIVSGINMTEGGILSILKDLLIYLDNYNQDYYEVIALVNKKERFEGLTKNIKYKEYPLSKKSWLIRLFYEYIYFYFYSKNKNIYLWLSMHDITPNVKAKKLITYCHNSTPFYKMKLTDIKFDKKLYLFSKFYKFLYKVNIKKNMYIIVQQQWIKEEFKKMYKIDNILVNNPLVNKNEINYKKIIKKDKKYIFFYPSIPRVFKNFEIVCKVAKNLEEKKIKNIKFILTVGEKINKYGDYIYKNYSHIKSLEFVGKLSREEVYSYYDYSDALIFSSKLETWGLPITEFKEFQKPILVSDLPYSKETVGNYELVEFFNPNSENELEKKILKILSNKKLSGNKFTTEGNQGWKNLFDKLKLKNIFE